VFLPTVTIVLFTLILGMFPQLIIAFSDRARFPAEINVWEPGIWMFPILISNVIIFSIIFLYQKNRLPYRLKNMFKFIFNFEISKRTSLLLIGVMIGSYALLTVGELSSQEIWGDFKGVETKIQNWSFDDWNFSEKPLMYFFWIFINGDFWQLPSRTFHCKYYLPFFDIFDNSSNLKK